MSTLPPSRRTSSGRVGAIAGHRPFGPYVLEERIAVGGTAEVLLARPRSGTSPAERLVVKRLLPALQTDRVAREMFAEEAELHRRFRHPNIVACFDAGEVEGAPYLAMELVHGADLHRVLRLGQARKRPLSPALAATIAREVLAALAVVHAARGEDGHPLGIVHRDVSPSNIYLSTDGEVKLGDFGIARPARTRTPRPGTLGSAVRGKFAYLAPEQVASQPVDHRSDLFACANILAESMLGEPLFPGSGQLAVLLAIRDVRIDVLDGAHGIPAPLVAILRRALARVPGDRYPDAQSFADALLPFAWTDPVQARREIKQLVRWARETSMELRAIGEHPDQPSQPDQAPIPSTGASTLPDFLQAAPAHDAPMSPVPSVAPPPLDSRFLDSLEIHYSTPQPEPASVRTTTEFTPAPSHVRTTDGRNLGPFTYAKLVEVVATGRVGGDDEVDFMGAGFIPILEIEELSRLLAPHSAATRQIVGPGNPDWHGVAAERYDADVGGPLEPGIATALAWIAARSASGVLLAHRARKRKELYFAGGRLLHIASSEPHDLIGEYLVSKEILDRGDLDLALAVLPRFDGHLGEALTSLGIVEPMVMFKAIQEQGRDKVADIFRWDEGELSFYAGAMPSKAEFPLDFQIGPLVEAGVAAMLDDRIAIVRYRPWIDRRMAAVPSPASLRDAQWTLLVDRAIQLAIAPITVRALLRTIALEGSQADAVRAVEAARLVGLLDWT